MILSYSRITLFSNGQKLNAILSKNAIPISSTRIIFLGNGIKKKVASRNSFKCKLVESENDSVFPISRQPKKGNKFHGDDEMIVAKESKEILAVKWKDIHGQNDWKGMLDPIDPLLRAELIRYGDMAQACYDAFDLDHSCKFDRSLFFKSIGRSKHGYYVESYIYSKYLINSIWSNGWSHKPNWIGYVAVSNDEYSAYLGRRDITIAWRGTVTTAEKIADCMCYHKPTRDYKIPSPDQKIRAEAGFLRMYAKKDEDCKLCHHSAREHVLAVVQRVKDRYSDEEISITITGHSLGSGLAIINAYDIAESGLDVQEDGRLIPLCVFSFSGPRVGNTRFKERLKELGVKVLRVVNIHDKVPAVPGVFLNEKAPTLVQKVSEFFLPFCYLHVGEELALDHKTSPFLKDIQNLTYFHNLEVHLHLLGGFHGKMNEFSLLQWRNLSLVNKSTDFLKDHLSVPPKWWNTEEWMIDHSPEEDEHHQG